MKKSVSISNQQKYSVETQYPNHFIGIIHTYSGSCVNVQNVHDPLLPRLLIFV